MKEYRIPVELLDCKVNETELKADEDLIQGNKQNIRRIKQNRNNCRNTILFCRTYGYNV